MNKMGSEMGGGNPPGQHSESYLTGSESGSDFTKSGSYRAGMDVGQVDTASVIGNQPKEKRESSLEDRANKTNSI